MHDKLMHHGTVGGCAHRGSGLGKKQNSEQKKTISGTGRVIVSDLKTINSKTITNENSQSAAQSPSMSMTLARTKEAEHEKSTNSLDRQSCSPESPGLRKSVLKTSKLGAEEQLDSLDISMEKKKVTRKSSPSPKKKIPDYLRKSQKWKKL